MTGPVSHKAPTPDTRTRRRRMRHALEWILLRGLMAFVRHGDMASAYARIHALSFPLRQILRSEWRWTQFNLQLVYGPLLTRSHGQRLAGMAFENIIRSHVDSMRVDDFSWQSPAQTQQLQILHDAFQQGQGVILSSVHLGSWEAGIKLIASTGYPLGVVYRHANNPRSEAAFSAIRASYDVEWIRRDESRKVLRVLQEKKILLLMADINQRQGGIAAPFLDIPAMSPVGAARLAARFQCPVVPGVCLREGLGQVRFLFAPPIDPLTGAVTTESLATMTARINGAFDTWIHTYAEQYNWLHARWRSRPDGTLWHIPTPQASDTLLASLHAARTTPYPALSPRITRLLA